MDNSHCDDEEKWYKEMEGKREDKQQKELETIFKETMVFFGIDQMKTEKI